MQNSTIRFLTNEDERVEAEITGPHLVAKGQRARFLIRPKCVAYKPQSLVIDESPGDWMIYDFNIHGRSQFMRTGDDDVDAIPGDVLSSSVDNRFSFDTVQTAMNLWVDVKYIGPRPDAAFLCTIRGLVAR